MKAKHKKRLEKVVQILREVIDEWEDGDQTSYDAYSEDLEQAVETVDDILAADERKVDDDEEGEEPDGFWDE
jgi:exonuclease VII small subunit